MSKTIDIEDLMELPAVSSGRDTGTEKWPRKKFWVFRLGLFLSDFLGIVISFAVAGWLTGVAFSRTAQLGWGILPALLAFMVMPFFSSSNLYSYHLIFNKKKHFAALYGAIAWGGVTVFLVAAQNHLPLVWESYPMGFLAIVSACAVAVVWVVRTGRCALHNLMRALGISMIAVGIIHLVTRGNFFFPLNLRGLGISLIVSAGVVTASRYVIIEFVYNKWLTRSFRRQVGIVGTNEEAENVASHVIDNNAPFWIAGTIGNYPQLKTSVPKVSLGSIVEIPAICRVNQLSDIIVTDESLDKRTLISLLDFAMSKGITVWFPPSVLPIIDRKIYIDNFCGLPMIRMCQQQRVVWYNRIKYGFDALLTLPALLLLSPVFGIIAAAIKINSKGPVFYLANAIGIGGQPFKMFKFRSMRMNNDNDIHKQFVTKLIKGEIGTENCDKKPLKITDDPRVTKVGRTIRKYSLDELPQLINVLIGQMSLIGPRPCLPYEYDVYQDWYKKRASIRPGITGLWQVAGRSEVAFEEMILLDLYYVYNRNIWMDLNILIETVFVVLKKKGAY